MKPLKIAIVAFLIINGILISYYLSLIVGLIVIVLGELIGFIVHPKKEIEPNAVEWSTRFIKGR